MNLRTFALVVLVGFVAVGVFGFAGMNHDMSHAGCIASVVNSNVVCPQEGLSAAFYHIAAYKSFSEAIAGSISFLLVAISLVLLAAAFGQANARVPVPVTFSHRTRERSSGVLYQKTKLLHWLSLFENSPSV